MNDFQKKALLNSIRSEGIDIEAIVSCSVYFSAELMYLSKIKIEDQFLYVRTHGWDAQDSDIKSEIILDIKNSFSNLSDTHNSLNSLINFIQDQLINKLNFDKKIVLSYAFESLRDYARDLSSKYDNGIDFVASIDKIDFDKFYEKCKGLT